MNRRLSRAATVLLVLFLVLPLSAQDIGSSPEAPPPPQKKTVGDVLDKLTVQPAEKGPIEVTQTPAASENTLPPASSQNGSVEKQGSGSFHLPEQQPKGTNWATEGRVGQSTFFDKLIDVCWSLALICLLVWASAKVAGKLGVKNLPIGGSTDSLIEILEKKRLSPGRTIMVMKVGPKVLAVAATENGYETLTEFAADDFKKYQDSLEIKNSQEKVESLPEGGMTPGDVARHYLSIIPGTGAKKS